MASAALLTSSEGLLLGGSGCVGPRALPSPLSSATCRVIAKGLVGCRSVILLDLSENRIDDLGGCFLARALKHNGESNATTVGGGGVTVVVVLEKAAHVTIKEGNQPSSCVHSIFDHFSSFLIMTTIPQIKAPISSSPPPPPSSSPLSFSLFPMNYFLISQSRRHSPAARASRQLSRPSLFNGVRQGPHSLRQPPHSI